MLEVAVLQTIAQWMFKNKRSTFGLSVIQQAFAQNQVPETFFNFALNYLLSKGFIHQPDSRKYIFVLVDRRRNSPPMA